MVIARKKEGRREVKESKGGISGGGKRLDFEC